MKRNKYLNTFNNTADYENYIESAYPDFPNVGLTKDDGELHYMRTSPNDHLFYGELVDATQPLPTIILYNNWSNVKEYTPTLDTLTNTFYIDDWDTVPEFNQLAQDSLRNKSNIKSIKKFKGLDTSKVTYMGGLFQECSALKSLDLSNFNTFNVTSMGQMFYNCSKLMSLDLSNWDTSKVTEMYSMFYNCSKLTSLDLSNWDTSNVTNMDNMFNSCSSLNDVYITVEATLNKLTNNLTSQGDNYIPSSATIHYNGVDYKWQNKKWTQQN